MVINLRSCLFNGLKKVFLSNSNITQQVNTCKEKVRLLRMKRCILQLVIVMLWVNARGWWLSRGLFRSPGVRHALPRRRRRHGTPGRAGCWRRSVRWRTCWAVSWAVRSSPAQADSCLWRSPPPSSDKTDRSVCTEGRFRTRGTHPRRRLHNL